MEAGQRIHLAVVIADAPAADLAPYLTLLQAADLRIAADGGARHFVAAGVMPHVAIGDFDSLLPELLAELQQHGVAIERHPVHKDKTDLELALLLAAEQGAARIAILAALGGRPDQHLANLQLLTHPALASSDVRMLDAGWELFVTYDTAHLAGRPGQTVSLLPMTERVDGIVTENLYYPLRDESLLLGPARGVSNVMTSDHAMVRIGSGILLVMHEVGKA